MSSENRARRRLGIVIALLAIVTPWMVYGSFLSMFGISTSAIRWLAQDEPGRVTYEQFTRHFEQGSAIVVSWDGCSIDDPRVDEVVDALKDADDSEGLGWFDQVLSGRSVLAKSTAEPLNVPRRLAIRRLEGTLIGPEKATCVVVVLTDDGLTSRREALDKVTRVATEALRIQEDDLFLAGSSVDAVAIDRASKQSVDYFSAPSMLICFFICWRCLGSIPYTLAILAVGGFGELLVLGSLHYLGITMDAVLVVLPPLVFVLTVSAGVHLVNYYLDIVRQGGKEDAPQLALKTGFVPCSVAAITTAMGVGSLMVSHIRPISWFGLFAAVGVLVTVCLLFVGLPGVMYRWPATTQPANSKRKLGNRWATQLAQFLCRYALLITLLGIIVLCVGVQGLLKVTTSISVHSLFTANSRVVRDYNWMEENIGPQVPLEVIVSFPQNAEVRFVDRMRMVLELESSIRSLERVGGTLSAASLSPVIPRGRKLSAVAARGRLNGRLEAHRDEFVKANYLFESADEQQWRISTRVSGLGEIDYEGILAELKTTVEERLKTPAFEAAGVKTEFTGVMPLVHQAQRTLLDDMFKSMLTAFVLVWAMMILVLLERPDQPASLTGYLASILRAVWIGTLAMLPNVFPIVAIFGWMGWYRIPIDIGSMMTACVALGISVDDTIHFLIWYRRELRSGRPPQQAIEACFHHCGKAMIQTTVICGIGLLVFYLSEFLPTQRFAVLMLSLLSTALIADLLFLPAMLASVLGRPFARSGARESRV